MNSRAPVWPASRRARLIGGIVALAGLLVLGREVVVQRALMRGGLLARRIREAAEIELPQPGVGVRELEALFWLLGPEEPSPPSPPEPPLSTGTGRSIVSPTTQSSRAPAPAPVVVLKSEVVRSLAESGAIPRGAPRAAAGELPAGIEILDGAGLGIGWYPGDRLVSVAGVPALERTAVVRHVLELRARGVPSIAATVARRMTTGVVTYQVLVEQPYLDASQDAAQAPSAAAAGQP